MWFPESTLVTLVSLAPLRLIQEITPPNSLINVIFKNPTRLSVGFPIKHTESQSNSSAWLHYLGDNGEKWIEALSYCLCTRDVSIMASLPPSPLLSLWSHCTLATLPGSLVHSHCLQPTDYLFALICPFPIPWMFSWQQKKAQPAFINNPLKSYSFLIVIGKQFQIRCNS